MCLMHSSTDEAAPSETHSEVENDEIPMPAHVEDDVSQRVEGRAHVEDERRQRVESRSHVEDDVRPRVESSESGVFEDDRVRTVEVPEAKLDQILSKLDSLQLELRERDERLRSSVGDHDINDSNVQVDIEGGFNKEIHGKLLAARTVKDLEECGFTFSTKDLLLRCNICEDSSFMVHDDSLNEFENLPKSFSNLKSNISKVRKQRSKKRKRR